MVAVFVMRLVKLVFKSTWTLIIIDCDGAVEAHVRKTSSTNSDSPAAATEGGVGVTNVQVASCE
jgi:hypothetical protein